MEQSAYSGTCRHLKRDGRVGLHKCGCSGVMDLRAFVLPRILLMLELCMSGKAWRILRRSSLAQTMKAFMGRLMCGSLLFLPRDSLKTRASPVLAPPVGQ